jgi:acetolactate synthase-1/2/3 large subunit
MSLAVEQPTGVTGTMGTPAWGSDVVLDMLRLLGIEYAAMNPGSSFRGIHDSAVNYAGNRMPELLLVNHEMIAVSMARGYARATGRPMVAILHDHVGLLNAAMTIYDAWVDRTPVLVLGGTGPLDAAQRRPWIDWIHTATDEGASVRPFTKWDDQPTSVEAIPEALMRAFRIATTEPGGPVYVCFDAALQETPVPGAFGLPDPARFRAPRLGPDPNALREAAIWLVAAERPVILADQVGRHPEAVDALVDLAELLAVPVLDSGLRQNFPTPHALDFAGADTELLGEADLVLGLDMVDLRGTLQGGSAGAVTPQTVIRTAAGEPRIVTIGVDELVHRGESTDYQALPPSDLPMLGDTALALPLLVEECRRLLDADPRSRVAARRTHLEERQAALRERQRAHVQAQLEQPGISETRIAVELWSAIRDQSFTLTYGKFRALAPGVMTLEGPAQSLGWGVGGGAVGAAPGVAIGAALALRGTGRLPVAILGDGELLASIQVLWTAAHHRIPALLVINNNRSYFNDEAHQDRVARQRGRPPENRWIGQRLEDPAVDFVSLARSLGAVAEGPVSDPDELPGVLARAASAAREGAVVVVDVRSERRPANAGRERPRS